MASRSYACVPPISLKEWQAMAESIYSEKNRRDYFLPDMLLHVIEASRGIAQGIRKESADEVLNAIPQTFMWFLSFCTRLKIDLERAVWAKYPGLCPYCGAMQYCSCIAQQKIAEFMHKNDSGTRPTSLDEWQEMFERIYGRVNRIVPFAALGFHFSEELSEVSRAFRFRGYEEGRQELELELADVFAWLMAIATRCGVKLSKLTYDAYPGACDTCKNEKCTCPKV